MYKHLGVVLLGWSAIVACSSTAMVVDGAEGPRVAEPRLAPQAPVPKLRNPCPAGSSPEGTPTDGACHYLGALPRAWAVADRWRTQGDSCAIDCRQLVEYVGAATVGNTVTSCGPNSAGTYVGDCPTIANPDTPFTIVVNLTPCGLDTTKTDMTEHLRAACQAELGATVPYNLLPVPDDTPAQVQCCVPVVADPGPGGTGT